MRRRTTSTRWSMKWRIASGRRKFLRLVVDHRKEDHREALLHLRVLVELVEHDLRFCAALQLDDDAHAVAVALVAESSEMSSMIFVVHQVGDALDELRSC